MADSNNYRIDEKTGKLYSASDEDLDKTNFKLKDNGKLYAEIGG